MSEASAAPKTGCPICGGESGHYAWTRDVEYFTRDDAFEYRLCKACDVIFIDRTLLDIAIRRPNDLEALRQCDGVGQGKLDRYGEAVLRIVRAA